MAAYIAQLTPMEQKILNIAASHLETSFSLSKSIGFLEWQKEQHKHAEQKQGQAQQKEHKQAQAEQKEQASKSAAAPSTSAAAPSASEAPRKKIKIFIKKKLNPALP